MKSGTASQVNGVFVEFQAAVIRAVPRDIGPDVALGWVKNGEALARVLRESLMPAVRSTYPVTVDYDLFISEAVARGKYDGVDSIIDTCDVVNTREGIANISIDLISFDFCGISENQVCHNLYVKGYRPAELHEFLAFGEKYPDIQRKLAIFALGSSLRSRGSYFFPCLCGTDYRRLLTIRRWGGAADWTGGWCWFAAVRK